MNIWVWRQQQVNDGCFSSLEPVPERDLTTTVLVFRRAHARPCVDPEQAQSGGCSKGGGGYRWRTRAEALSFGSMEPHADFSKGAQLP